MPKTQQTIDYLQKARNEGPSHYKRLSDEALYYNLRTQNKITDLTSWDSQDKALGYGKYSQTAPEQQYQQEGDINTLQQYSDYWIDENSYDWAKAAYNRSLTGNVEQLMTGKQRYDVDDTDFNILEDIGASLLSFIMPLDIFSMFTGGLAGKALSKGLAKGMANKANSQILKKLPKSISKWSPEETSALMSTLSSGQKMLVGAAGQAPALAVYEGAMGGVQAGLNGDNVLGGVTYGVLHGGFLGGVTGAVGTGLGGLQAKLLQKGQKEALTGFEKFRAYGFYGMPGQVLGEAVTFTGINTAERMYHAIKSGEDVDANAILRDFYHDVGMTTFLKGKQKVMKYGSDVINDIKQASRQEIIKKQDIENKTNDIKSNVRKNINEDPNISDRNKDEINSSFDKDAISVDATLKDKSTELDNLDLRLKTFIKYLDDGVFTDKDVARKQLTDLKNSLVEADGVIDNYLKEKGGAESDVAFASNLEKRARQAKEQFKKIDADIDAKFDAYIKSKGDESDIHVPFGFKTLKEAKEKSMTLTDSEISNEANKFGIDTTGKLADKAQRDVIIERIYESEKSKFLKEKEIAKQTGTGGTKDIISEIRQITGKKDVKDMELDVLKKKTLESTEKSIPQVKKSRISNTHKNLLAFTLDKAPKNVAHSKGSTETIKLFDYIENKFKKNINELSKTEKKQAIKDYIHERVGLDIYDITQSELNKRFGTNNPEGLREYRAMSRKADRIRDSLGEIFTKAKLGEALGAPKIISDIGKFNVAGARKPTIVGGREGFKKWIKFVEDKPKGIEYSKNKKISSEESSLAIELASHENALLRPGELVNVKASHINAQTGEIKIIRQKVKGQKQEVDYIVDKDLAKKLQDLADSKGIKGERRLFPFESAKDVNNFAKYLAKNSGTGVLVEHQVLGETFKWDDVIPGSKGVEDIKAGKGLEYGRAFRGLYEGEVLTEKGKIEQTQNLGQKLPHTKLHYKRKNIKEKFQKVTSELQNKIDTGIETQVKQKEYFESIPAYKKITINLKKKFGNNKGNRVLGRIRGHIINVADGKVRLDTLPHEVSHYVKDVLEQFGTAKDKSLINRGINLFAKELKRGQRKIIDSKGKEKIERFKESKESFRERQEELLVQRIGELAAGQITNRTMMSKFKNWVKAVNSRMKEFFGIANKDDIAFILSRRVVKGNIPVGRQVENYINGLNDHFQTVKEDPSRVKSYNKELKKQEQGLLDAGIEGGRGFLDETRAMFGIEPSGTGRKALDTSVASYERYLRELESHAEIIPKVKKGETMIERLAEDYNVTRDELSNVVVNLGEPSGIASNMSKKSKAYITHYIKTHGKKTKPTSISAGEVAQLSGDRLTWVQSAGKMFLPAYYFIQKHGGKAGEKIADRILGFDVALHTEFKGPGEVHINNIKKILGGKKSDFVRNFDLDRSTALLKAEKEGKTFGIKMSREEKKFIEDMKIDGTEANLAYKEHKALTNFYWKKLGEEVKKITNKAEYEKFLKEYNEKFVVDYHTRKVTQEAINHFTKEKPDSKHIQALVDENLKRAASQDAIAHAKKLHKSSKNITPNHSKNMAINESYKKTFTNKYNENLKSERLRIEIADGVMALLTQQHSKVKNSYLLKRGPLLPEYIEITKRNGQKKIIQTYESSISRSIDPYVAGMSKYLATLRYFPEYTGLGGKYTVGSSRLLQLKTIIKDKEVGKYAKDTIERLIGVYKENESHSRVADFLGATAHLSAAAGLSSPTSGIKNLLIGIPRSIASFGLGNTGRGILKAFNTNAWDEARVKGTLDFGSKGMELPTASLGRKGMLKYFSMENLFKYVNLMTFTENVNRIVSMEAGKLYFANNLQMLRGKTGIFGKSSPAKIKRLFKDQYKLPESEIKFLEKGDLSTIEGTKRLENIQRHVEFYSHASAQGTTSIGLIPNWAGSQLGKPLTLFMRMAYSTTFDSYKNYLKPAIKHGNIAPLAKALMAHAVSGAALYTMYEALFDKEPTDSAGTAGDKMFMYLWRSEFLGLFGGIISPYDDGTFQSISDPVIIRNLSNGKKELWNFIGGKESFEDASQNWLKKSLVLYSQYENFKKVKGNKAYSEMLVMNNWEKQFKKQFDVAPSRNEDYSVRTVYYRKLKEALWEGKEKEIERHYISAYNYLVTDIMENRPGTVTATQAHKLAIQRLKSSVKYMAPVSFTKKGKYVVTPRREYLTWVEKNFGKEGLKRIKEQEYQYRLRKKLFEKTVANKKLWREKSVFANISG